MNLSKTPQFQSFQLEGVNHISPADALEAINQGTALIIDVRELSETFSIYIPHDNVLFHPMSVIIERLNRIPTDKLLIVACNSGIRSVKVANLFNVQGFKTVANLDGGIEEWKKQGLPIEENTTTFTSSCGCGCSPSEETKEQEEPSSGCGCDCSSGCC